MNKAAIIALSVSLFAGTSVAAASSASAAPVKHKMHSKAHAHKAHEHKLKAKEHKAHEHKLHAKSIKPKALPKSGYGGVSE